MCLRVDYQTISLEMKVDLNSMDKTFMPRLSSVIYMILIFLVDNLEKNFMF